MAFKFNPLTGQFDIDTINPGDITAVNAGTNLNGGGSSGDVTLNLDTAITDMDSVGFDVLYTPTGSEPIGTMYWHETDGTFNFVLKNGSILQAGQELHFYGKASGAIANGDPIEFAGVQGDHILIKKAVAAEIDANPEYFIGVATNNIANGDYGYVTWFGKINGIYTKTPANNDSANWVEGDVLYLNMSTGYLTKTEPTAPTRKIIVAAVIKTQTGSSENGIILVRPTLGVKLADLNDVDGSAPNATGDLLTWNNSTSTWERNSYNITDYAPILINTRAAIQATTPSSTTIGFCTDTLEQAVYYSGAWYFQPLKLIVRSGSGVDMGYTQDNSLIGIDSEWISQKTLSDIYIGSNVDTTNASATRIPLRASGGTLQIYVSGSWQTIVSNFVFSEDSSYGYALKHQPVGFTRYIEIMTGNSISDLGLNGLPLTHSYTNDMGAYPTSDWVGGRQVSAT